MKEDLHRTFKTKSWFENMRNHVLNYLHIGQDTHMRFIHMNQKCRIDRVCAYPYFMEKRSDNGMTKNKRYMVDDAGTLIDMQTRECYDVVEEVVDLLNYLNNENDQLKKENEKLEIDTYMQIEKTLYWRNKANNIFGDMKTNVELSKENKRLKQQLRKV